MDNTLSYLDLPPSHTFPLPLLLKVSAPECPLPSLSLAGLLGWVLLLEHPLHPSQECTQVYILHSQLLSSPTLPLNSALSLIFSVPAFIFFNRERDRDTKRKSMRRPRTSQILPYWLSFLIQLSSGLNKIGVNVAAVPGAELRPMGAEQSLCTHS